MTSQVADHPAVPVHTQLALVLQLVIVAFGCVVSTWLAFALFAFGMMAGSAAWLLPLLVLVSMPSAFVVLLVGNARARGGRPNLLAIAEIVTAAPTLWLTARAAGASAIHLVGYGYVALALVVLYDLRAKVR